MGRGAASLSLGEGKATLQLREAAQCAALDLFKLPIAEARSQVQALVFGMAGRIESLERRLEGPGGVLEGGPGRSGGGVGPGDKGRRRAGSSLLPSQCHPPHPKVPQVTRVSQQWAKACASLALPQVVSPCRPRVDWQQAGQQRCSRLFPVWAGQFPIAGQGLHLTTLGRRGPAWDQGMQCCISVQKHSLVPMVSTTPSSLCVGITLQGSLF